MRRLSRIFAYLVAGLLLAVAAWFAALTNFAFSRELFPQQWATAQSLLGIAYYLMPGERADNLEKAIAYYEAALTVFTPEASLRPWATTQKMLAIAYDDHTRGDLADNKEKALGHYEAALTVYTRESFPQEWAETRALLAVVSAPQCFLSRPSAESNGLVPGARRTPPGAPATCPRQRTRDPRGTANGRRAQSTPRDHEDRHLARAAPPQLPLHTHARCRAPPHCVPPEIRLRSRLWILPSLAQRWFRPLSAARAIPLADVASTIFTKQPTRQSSACSHQSFSHRD